jgi:hypothetical protein
VSSLVRSAVFALTGIHSLAYWLTIRPSAEVTDAQGQWPQVLWFSAMLLILGLAVLVFGRMVGTESVLRWATFAFAAIGLASLINIVEDGFRVEYAFLFFILSTLIFDLALIAMATVIAWTARGRSRLLAVVPAGTLAGILFFVTAGGPILLVTWLTVAVAALTITPRPASAVPTA